MATVKAKAAVAVAQVSAPKEKEKDDELRTRLKNTLGVDVFGAWTPSEIIDGILPFALTSLGAFHESPSVFYGALWDIYRGFAGAMFVICLTGDFLCDHFGKRIQKGKRRSGQRVSEMMEQFRSNFIMSFLFSWPLARHRLGYPVACAWKMEDASMGLSGPFGLLVWGFLAFLTILFIDFYLYWKHRMFHVIPILWGFHKKHHTFNDPTCWSAFSQGPMESLVSFWMALLLCQDFIVIWAPIDIAVVCMFVAQNVYLHCGVTFVWAEKMAQALMMDSSSFHNQHHSRRKGNYGEALRIWDTLCGTRFEDQKAVRDGALRPLVNGDKSRDDPILDETDAAAAQAVAAVVGKEFHHVDSK